MGHSFGGFVAFEYAVRHPERLAFLVVVCSSPTVDYLADIAATLEARMTPAMREEMALPLSTTPQQRASRPGILPLYFHRYRPAYWAALNDRVIHTPEAARCSDLNGWDRWDELAGISRPTLLIAGRHDWIPHLPDSVAPPRRSRQHNLLFSTTVGTSRGWRSPRRSPTW